MAHDTQALTLRRITKQEAARAFAPCAGLDPEGRASPQSAADAGDCFAVSGQGGEVAFSVGFGAGVAWVYAAAGGGDRMAAPTLDVIERLARAHGCDVVQFQTVRAGLRRVAHRRGYKTTERIGAGWVLAKPL